MPNEMPTLNSLAVLDLTVPPLRFSLEQNDTVVTFELDPVEAEFSIQETMLALGETEGVKPIKLIPAFIEYVKRTAKIEHITFAEAYRLFRVVRATYETLKKKSDDELRFFDSTLGVLTPV